MLLRRAAAAATLAALVAVLVLCSGGGRRGVRAQAVPCASHPNCSTCADVYGCVWCTDNGGSCIDALSSCNEATTIQACEGYCDRFTTTAQRLAVGCDCMPGLIKYNGVCTVSQYGQIVVDPISDVTKAGFCKVLTSLESCNLFREGFLTSGAFVLEGNSSFYNHVELYCSWNTSTGLCEAVPVSTPWIFNATCPECYAVGILSSYVARELLLAAGVPIEFIQGLVDNSYLPPIVFDRGAGTCQVSAIIQHIRTIDSYRDSMLSCYVSDADSSDVRGFFEEFIYSFDQTSQTLVALATALSIVIFLMLTFGLGLLAPLAFLTSCRRRCSNILSRIDVRPSLHTHVPAVGARLFKSKTCPGGFATFTLMLIIAVYATWEFMTYLAPRNVPVVSTTASGDLPIVLMTDVRVLAMLWDVRCDEVEINVEPDQYITCSLKTSRGHGCLIGWHFIPLLGTSNTLPLRMRREVVSVGFEAVGFTEFSKPFYESWPPRYCDSLLPSRLSRLDQQSYTTRLAFVAAEIPCGGPDCLFNLVNLAKQTESVSLDINLRVALGINVSPLQSTTSYRVPTATGVFFPVSIPHTSTPFSPPLPENALATAPRSLNFSFHAAREFQLMYFATPSILTPIISIISFAGSMLGLHSLARVVFSVFAANPTTRGFVVALFVPFCTACCINCRRRFSNAARYGFAVGTMIGLLLLLGAMFYVVTYLYNQAESSIVVFVLLNVVAGSSIGSTVFLFVAAGALLSMALLAYPIAWSAPELIARAAGHAVGPSLNAIIPSEKSLFPSSDKTDAAATEASSLMPPRPPPFPSAKQADIVDTDSDSDEPLSLSEASPLPPAKAEAAEAVGAEVDAELLASSSPRAAASVSFVDDARALTPWRRGQRASVRAGHDAALRAEHESNDGLPVTSAAGMRKLRARPPPSEEGAALLRAGAAGLVPIFGPAALLLMAKPSVFELTVSLCVSLATLYVVVHLVSFVELAAALVGFFGNGSLRSGLLATFIFVLPFMFIHIAFGVAPLIELGRLARGVRRPRRGTLSVGLDALLGATLGLFTPMPLFPLYLYGSPARGVQRCIRVRCCRRRDALGGGDLEPSVPFSAAVAFGTFIQFLGLVVGTGVGGLSITIAAYAAPVEFTLLLTLMLASAVPHDGLAVLGGVRSVLAGIGMSLVLPVFSSFAMFACRYRHRMVMAAFATNALLTMTLLLGSIGYIVAPSFLYSMSYSSVVLYFVFALVGLLLLVAVRGVSSAILALLSPQFFSIDARMPTWSLTRSRAPSGVVDTAAGAALREHLLEESGAL